MITLDHKGGRGGAPIKMALKCPKFIMIETVTIPQPKPHIATIYQSTLHSAIFKSVTIFRMMPHTVITYLVLGLQATLGTWRADQ